MERENRNQIHKSRRVTFKKRKACIMKKTMELATLCGINACTVCFGPDGKEVETWPEKPSDVKTLIDMYRHREHDAKDSRLKKAVQQQPPPQPHSEKKNVKMVLSGWNDGWLSGLSREELTSLLSSMQLKLQALTSRIEFLKSSRSNMYHQHHPPLMEPSPTGTTTGSGYSYRPMFATPVWPLNCYGGGGPGSGGDVPLPWKFNETLEETKFAETRLLQPSPLHEVLFAPMYMRPVQMVAPPRLSEEAAFMISSASQGNPRENVNLDLIM